jgi:hypothetical protein
MNELKRAISLLSPLLVGFIVQGLCIKFHLLAALAKPIDAGCTFRNRRLFGENKTYRGVIAFGMGTAIGFLLHAALVGTTHSESEALLLNQPDAITFFSNFLRDWQQCYQNYQTVSLSDSSISCLEYKAQE